MEYVRLLAQKPHRAGTAANDDVRFKLLEFLNSQGLKAVTDDQTVSRGWTIANPCNIMVRLPGTGKIGSAKDHQAFLLMAHYDSVPYGPGAADNLSGVAAILETLRAIKAGPALTNDLICVFTDGEECGLLGAKKFAGHPWAKEVGCMLNFEARGVCGPSYLFELGEPKAWLVEEIARSRAPVRTSSLMFEVFRRLPFTTDFHMLRDFIPGMNIAFIGRFPYYHSVNDNPQHLDLRSLQHHGAYALAFARHFGNISLNADYSKPAPIFFSLFGAHLFYYSKSWSVVLTILNLALFVLFIWRERIYEELASGWRRCDLRNSLQYAIYFYAKSIISQFQRRWKRFEKTNGIKSTFISQCCFRSKYIFEFLLFSPLQRLRGFAAFGLLIFAGVFVATFVLGVGWLCRGPYMFYANGCFVLSGCFLSAAAVIVTYGAIRRRILLRNLERSVLFFWTVGMVLQTLFLPAGAFFWQWPLFAALLGGFGSNMLTGKFSGKTYLLMHSGKEDWVRENHAETFQVGFTVCNFNFKKRLFSPVFFFGSVFFLFLSMPVLAFGVPLLSGLAEALLAFSLPIIAICAILGVGLLLPLIDRSLLALKRLLSGVFVISGIIFLLWGIALSAPSKDCPRMSQLLYHLNADNGEAHWCSVEAELGSWTRQFFTLEPVLKALPELPERLFWQSPAPQGSMLCSLPVSMPCCTPAILQGSIPAPISGSLSDPLPAPIAELLDQSIGTDSRRVLGVRLSSPRGANRLLIHGFSKASTLSGKMNGVPLEIGGHEWTLDYSVLPQKPVELRLVLESNAVLTLVLTDISYSLPNIVPPRPDDCIPMNNVLNRGSRCESDTTHVMKSFSL
ncbi:MAG: M20/M25/M40 family metallo-hydrolase [Candidatus Riflebacteria bacterium]|nr:M20/M25/M40 family metallo-hydrolase [Candidatus Riflebacteria bacterium]